MRISDWSSDVCSSDLPGAPEEEVLELTDVAGGEAPAEDPAIVSDATASATAERLKALSSAMAGPESGSVTLEGLVREMLRPMLKAWLDRNLPDIVDEVVPAEIARLTGKGPQGLPNRPVSILLGSREYWREEE